MTPEAHLITWLEPLWQLYPAQGVIVVGAGNGSSPWIAALQRWNAPNVTLVEADDVQFQHLQHQLSSQDGWQLRKQVIAAETGSVTYYRASNPAESGLIEPAALQTLWPNLKTRQACTRQGISLTDLMAVTEPTANWLLLDCLPAGALLAGAGDALAACDVIVTRALLPEAGADLAAAQADASTITQLLQAQGFCTLAKQTSCHPGVAHTLHVRDRTAQLHAALAAMQEQLAQTTQAQVTAKQALDYRDAKLKALQAELLQAKQSVQKSAEQIVQLTQQCSALQVEAAQWSEAAENARVDAAQTKALASQSLVERDAQLKAMQDELLRVRENEIKIRAAQQLEMQAKAEMLGQIQALKQENIDLARAKDDEVAARFADLKEKSIAIARAEKLQLELKKPNKNQDADIDDFINDLSDLFFGMSLSYVDVGAFTGQVYKKLLDSKKVSIREAHLYEPNPESYVELKKILIPGHAHAYQVAVSDNVGTVNLIPGRSMTKIVDDNYSGLGDIFSVNCVKLDDQSELYTDKKINILKIDVEGGELNVLRGAGNLLLNQWVDLIYVEVGFNLNGTQQTYFGKIDEYLQKFNYRVYKIYEQKNEWISDSPLLRRCNFAYLSSKFSALRPLSLLKQISRNR